MVIPSALKMPGKENNVRQRNHGKDAEKADNPRLPMFSKKRDNNQGTSKKTIIACVVVVFSVGLTLFLYRHYLQVRVQLPLMVPKINDDNSTSASVDPERFWGTYRPNLYFGLKTR